MQRENERHTQRLTATQGLAHSVRVRQCVRQNRRREESVFVCVCVLVRVCACVRTRPCALRHVFIRGGGGE